MGWAINARVDSSDSVANGKVVFLSYFLPHKLLSQVTPPLIPPSTLPLSLLDPSLDPPSLSLLDPPSTLPLSLLPAITVSIKPASSKIPLVKRVELVFDGDTPQPGKVECLLDPTPQNVHQFTRERKSLCASFVPRSSLFFFFCAKEQ